MSAKPRFTAGVVKAMFWGFALALIWLSLPTQSYVLKLVKSPFGIFTLALVLSFEFGIVLVIGYLITRKL